jgi:4-hydroxysphinganine ceramide fatty acyl 2-hydroxylase
MMTQRYTSSQVAAHTSSDSCWIIYNNKVYNVSEFLADHPGGDDLILDYAGKDVTAVMKDVLEHEHSEAAYDILADYCIGTLDNTLTTTTTTTTTATGYTTASAADTDKKSTLHRQRMQVLEELEESKTYGQADFHPKETDAATDMKTTQFLDLRRALIPQFFTTSFTKEFYLEQVHRPRYLPTPAIFFGHPLLEPLSKTVWYVVPLLWLPFAAYQFSKSLALTSGGFLSTFSLGLGVVIWTLLEYLLHRFLFHVDDYLPDHQIAFLLHFTLHGFHHYLPMDK